MKTGTRTPETARPKPQTGSVDKAAQKGSTTTTSAAADTAPAAAMTPLHGPSLADGPFDRDGRRRAEELLLANAGFSLGQGSSPPPLGRLQVGSLQVTRGAAGHQFKPPLRVFTDDGAKALSAVAAPPADHPYRQHIEGTRQELEARGLPTRADGVRVFVLDRGDHAEKVARTIAGPVGLAQGADLHIEDRTRGDFQAESFQINDDQLERRYRMHRTSNELRSGDVGLDELAQRGTDSMEHVVHEMRRSLSVVRDVVAKDPRDEPSVVNFSWGTSIYGEGLAQTRAVLRAPAGSRLHQEATALLGHPPTPADGRTLHDMFCRRIDERLQTPDVAEQMGRAREHLGADLADAQREGIVVINASGNDHDRAERVTDVRYAQCASAGVPNLVTVGAGQLNDIGAPHDDAMAPFSNAGATLSAPGVDIPVGAAPGGDGAGPAAPEDIDGTSFSAPYVSMTAALMIKANPSLSATELYQALRDPSICRDLPGARDGNGMLDPVAAVSLAKSLARDS